MLMCVCVCVFLVMLRAVTKMQFSIGGLSNPGQWDRRRKRCVPSSLL